MFSKYQYIAIIIGGLSILSSCTQTVEQKQGTTGSTATVAKPALMQPFRYHKLIESSPGKYFDVFSWGRGVDTTGAYIIFRSDSTGKQYSTTTGDLEGAIVDVFNTDMNMDGYPEILIEAKAKDTTNHVNIYAYEFRGTKGQKIDFPKLTSKTKNGYRGNDRFYIKEGNLIREFPLYEGTGKTAKATGTKKILQYGIRNNEFTVKDISTAYVTVNDKPTEEDAVKKTAVKDEKPTVKEKKSSRKHKREQPHHTKKKHHRHRR